MRRLILAVAIVSLACGCGSSGRPTHDLTLDEFSIATRSVHLPAASTGLSVANVGDFGHTVVIADEHGEVIQASPLIPAGADTAIAIDLPPGTYEVTCRLVLETEDGLVDHYQEGMHTTIVVDP